MTELLGWLAWLAAMGVSFMIGYFAGWHRLFTRKEVPDADQRDPSHDPGP